MIEWGDGGSSVLVDASLAAPVVATKQPAKTSLGATGAISRRNKLLRFVNATTPISGFDRNG